VATSGDKTWSLTRNDIIHAALRKIGEFDSADGPSTPEYTDAALALNAITKELAAEGTGLWLRQTVVLFLYQGVHRYQSGESGWNIANRTNYRRNTIASDEAAAQTVISINDASWADGETTLAAASVYKPTSGNIGIRLDSGIMHWTTISAVGANTVTIASALPTQASAGRQVYTYTAGITKPLRLVAAYRRDVNRIDTPVRIVGRQEYEALSQKYSSGPPLVVHFDAKRLKPEIFVWPVQNGFDVDELHLVTEHYVDDFDAANNDMDFPAEWGNALIWLLAAELSFEYGVDPQTRVQLMRVADSKKLTLLHTMDVENASVMFAPSEGP
jgi:hypothetical protein